MDYTLINNAFCEAESVMRSANRCATRALNYGAGKLRSLDLDTETLRALKRELQSFDAKRGKWLHR